MQKIITILLVDYDPGHIELTLNAIHKYNIQNNLYILITKKDTLDYIWEVSKFSDRTQHLMPDLILLNLGLPDFSCLRILEKI